MSEAVAKLRVSRISGFFWPILASKGRGLYTMSDITPYPLTPKAAQKNLSFATASSDQQKKSNVFEKCVFEEAVLHDEHSLLPKSARFKLGVSF